MDSYHKCELLGNYPVFTVVMVIYTSVKRIMHYYITPDFPTILYTYPLRYIIYLRELLVNIISNYHGTFIHLYMHWYDSVYKRYKRNSRFFFDLYGGFFVLIFLCEQYIKNFIIIYKAEFLFLLISVNFISCRLPQANLLQHCIHFLIRKRKVQKPQPSSI